jgi:PAT family acetyl-CoA transporter-like MFS transporter 1
MRSYVGVLLVSKIGFICHEAVTSLKLLEKGFSREDLALSVLLDFPLQIFFGYYAAKWSNGQRPLKPVMYYNSIYNSPFF